LSALLGLRQRKGSKHVVTWRYWVTRNDTQPQLRATERHCLSPRNSPDTEDVTGSIRGSSQPASPAVLIWTTRSWGQPGDTEEVFQQQRARVMNSRPISPAMAATSCTCKLLAKERRNQRGEQPVHRKCGKDSGGETRRRALSAQSRRRTASSRARPSGRTSPSARPGGTCLICWVGIFASARHWLLGWPRSRPIEGLEQFVRIRERSTAS
jgi:hypothetical protein